MATPPTIRTTWQQALADLPEKIDLPGVRRSDETGPPSAPATAPTAGASAVTAVAECRIDPRLREAMTVLAGGGDADPSGAAGAGTVFTAGVAALLTLLRAGTDLPLGTTAPGTAAGVRVLRVATSPERDFHALVAAVRSAERTAADQDGVPYAELAASVNTARATPGLPLFQVGAAVDTAPPPPEPGRADALWFTLHTETAAGPGAVRSHVRLTFPLAVLDRDDAQDLCDRLVRVLTRAVRAPGARLGTIPCLLPGEAVGLIGEGHAGEVPEGTLAGWFERRATLSGEAVAVVDGSLRRSYAQLNARANRLARTLVAAGAGPERVVAIVLPRSELSVTAFLAVLKAGATYLPIDPELPPERVALMLADAAPVVTVTEQRCGELVPAGPAPVLVLDPELSACAGQRSDDLTSEELISPVAGATPAYLLYTSGSTGRPKGVLMTQEAVRNLMAWHLDELPGAPGRVTVQFTSVSFDISVQEVLSTLFSGATLAIVPEDVRSSPRDFAPWLEEHGVTDLFAPNVVIELICQAALEQGRTLPALTRVAQAGEALVLSETLREFFRLRPDRRLYNHYGPTETHAVTSYALPADVAAWPATAPVGHAVWNASVYVLDDELRLVPPGVAGELYASGLCLARGYSDRPGLTAERFLPDPYGPPGARMYHTGDLVRRLRDGSFEYLGRTDHQIKIRGIRIELGEIEAALRAAPGVRDVALVTAGAGGERRIDAYLVPAPGTDPAALGPTTRAELRRTLPPVMVPATFTVLAAFPLNSNGKVDRKALPEPVFTGPDVSERPGTDDEERLAKIFAEVLKVPAVGVRESFYDIGGHSLLAAELTARIRKEFQAELTFGDVLASPSVAELAVLLGRVDPARPPVAPRGGYGPAPASFAQQSLWVLDQLEGPSPRYNEPFALRLTGRVDVPALRRALADVVDRHEVLRTVLVMEEGQITQRVRDGAAAVPVLDETDVAPEALATELRAAARAPFDLAADPPVRGLLCHLGEDTQVLLLVLHHVACDGVSLEPLLRDLAAAYDARTAGHAPAWAPLPVQYADYAVWQRDLFASAETGRAGLLGRQYRYWEAKLAGLPTAIPLPLDRPRPAVRSGAGGSVPFSLAAGPHRALRALANARRTSTFTVVHAALAALLRERGAGDDIVVATVVSDRGDAVLEDLVGFFVRTLVLRVDASGDPDFPALLDRVREADLAAFAHQDLPFEHLVELVNPARSLEVHPLAQVMLAFQVEEAAPPRLAGLTARHEPVDLGVAKFDLCFKVVERYGPEGDPAGVEGVLEYATDVFDPATATALAEGMTRILERGAAGGAPRTAPAARA
ncbi:amino acid adenylation domain-containing protein [Streptomyces sp. NPDC088258]|uniref:amino acid adenylation domain-containing protein n=1 Tax=Streptomyces sp. NPDC088258 TaxID=3365849 RepID=UPI00381AEB22